MYEDEDMRLVVSAVIGLSALSVTTHSVQQIDRPQEGFGAAVDLVQVDVSVLDKSRRPVRDLHASNFTLLVDGQPRPIAAFTAVELPTSSVAPKSTGVHDAPADVTTNEVPERGRLVV